MVFPTKSDDFFYPSLPEGSYKQAKRAAHVFLGVFQSRAHHFETPSLIRALQVSPVWANVYYAFRSGQYEAAVEFADEAPGVIPGVVREELRRYQLSADKYAHRLYPVLLGNCFFLVWCFVGFFLKAGGELTSMPKTPNCNVGGRVECQLKHRDNFPPSS